MSVFSAKAKPTALLLVCTKCFKRTGAKDRLTGPLKRALKPDGVKLVKTRCLGVCPKGAVVLHDSRKPREWTIVRADTAIDTVVAAVRRAPDQGASGTGSLPESALASALAAAVRRAPDQGASGTGSLPDRALASALAAEKSG